MRKAIYFLLTCLIVFCAIYGAFQLYFFYRTQEESYAYQSTPSLNLLWFEVEITNIGEHGMKGKVIEQVIPEENVTKTLAVPISEETIIKDKEGNPIEIASLIVGQKVRMCVMNGVIYEDCVRTDTLHHTRYIKCYEIQIID